MNQNDLHEMSHRYRGTREAVYEEATRPLSNNSDIHGKNKERLKESVGKLCDDADFRRYREADKGTATVIWHQLWTKNRYAGIRAQFATKEVSDIETIFDYYERFSATDWDIEASGHKVIRCGCQVHDCS